MHNKKIVIFDFDGVIVDSFNFCYEINKLEEETLTEEVYRQRFEGNINDHYPASRQVPPGYNFFTLYEPRVMERRPVDGIETVIKELAETYQLYIISSTETGPIARFLEKYDLRKYFNAILGNDIETSKSKKIQMIFERYDIAAPDCVFITDTLGDIREGLMCEVRSIATTWGFHDEVTLRKGNPIIIVQRPKDIVPAVINFYGQP